MDAAPGSPSAANPKMGQATFSNDPGSCSDAGCPVDLDGDGIVGGEDLGLLLRSWAACD